MANHANAYSYAPGITCVSLPVSSLRPWQHALFVHGQAVRELMPKGIAVSHCWLGTSTSASLTLCEDYSVAGSTCTQEIPRQAGLQSHSVVITCLITRSASFSSLTPYLIPWNHLPNKWLAFKSLS